MLAWLRKSRLCLSGDRSLVLFVVSYRRGYSTDDILLFALRSKATTPSDYSVVGSPRSYNSHGLLVQKNSTVFLSLVNATLSRMARDGRLQKLCEKWFASDRRSLSPVLGTVLNVFAIPE